MAPQATLYMAQCWTAVSPRLKPAPRQHPVAVCPSPLLQEVVALYPPHVSSLAQMTGMPMFPNIGLPCAARHGTGASEADTGGEDSHLEPVQAFRTSSTASYNAAHHTMYILITNNTRHSQLTTHIFNHETIALYYKVQCYNIYIIIYMILMFSFFKIRLNKWYPQIQTQL